MQIQYKLNMLRSFAVCAIMACSLMPLIGCTAEGELDTTVSHTPNGTSESVTGKIIFKRSPTFAMWMSFLSGTDLAGMDPNQALMNYSLSNAAIASTGGSATITVTDDNTGSTVGQQAFQYVVSGNSLRAQDPTAVSTWLNQFTSYSNLSVTVAATTAIRVISPGPVTVTNNAVYQGTSYSSSSTSWTATNPDSNCGTDVNCLPAPI